MAHVERNDPYQKRGISAPQAQRYLFAAKMLDKFNTVADLGCGYGYGVKILTDNGFDIIGMDYSDDAIDTAYDRYGGRYIKVDLNDLSLRGFKNAVCLETLCHLQNPAVFLDLTSVEQLVVSAPIDPDPNDGYIYRKHNYSEKEFLNLFKDKWQIIEELRQTYGVTYLTLFARRKK